MGLVYMHLVDHSSMGTPAVSKTLTETMKKNLEERSYYPEDMIKYEQRKI